MNAVRGDFARHHQVIVFDQRGTGHGVMPEQPPYSTRDLAEDAVALLDDLHLARAHVCGISMGGAVGQWLDVDHSARVGALVLACSSPGGPHAVPRTQEIRALLAQPDQRKVFETFFAHKRALSRFLLSMRESVTHPMPEYSERLHARAGEEHDAWELLPAITAPTLVIHGSDDRVAPVANAYMLAERIPRAELYVVRDGRRMFFIEFRRETDRVVKRFFAGHPLDR